MVCWVFEKWAMNLKVKERHIYISLLTIELKCSWYFPTGILHNSTILWYKGNSVQYDCGYPHFTNEEMEKQSSINLP